MSNVPAPAEARPVPRRSSPAAQAKRAAILKAAEQAFLEEGYQLASMDRVAERADTTKRTVYDHFGSKDALFFAVIAASCRSIVAALPGPAALKPDPREGLAQLARAIATVVGSVDCIRLQRLVISEAERHPQFAAMLYDTALLGAEMALIGYLEHCVATKRLKPHDCQVSSRLLIDVMIHGASLRKLLAVSGREAERLADMGNVDQVIDFVVSAFRMP